MTDNDSDNDDSEYRPTDYLASLGLSYGIGHTEEQAVAAAMRYGGPWENRDEPLTVAVWELYADSWKTHSPSGPERGAEWISFRRYEVPVKLADQLHQQQTEAQQTVRAVVAEDNRTDYDESENSDE